MMILFAFALLAQASPAPQPESQVTVTGPEERRICRQVGPQRSSASRIARRRVCRTATQWREVARNDPASDGGEAGADDLEVITRTGAIRNGGLAPRP